MIKKTATFSLILFLFLHLPGQSTIENPERPLNPKSGRKVEFKEVLRINDMGDPYYFRYPRNLRVDPNGSIFVQDDKQLLRFSPEGKFIRNYIKTGQGPGEINILDNFFILEDAFFMSSYMPSKIIWTDYEGSLLKEIHLRTLKHTSRYFHYYKNRYYFSYLEMGSAKKKREFVDLPLHFLCVSSDGKNIKKLLSFSTKQYVIGRSDIGVGLAELVAVMIAPYKGRYVYISHTEDYLVKLYDLESNNWIRAFRRPYEKVKALKNQRKEFDPPRKYYNDIQRLLIYQDKLWVLTSTRNKDNGVLVDVYDFEGQYVDNFYIYLPGNIAPPTLTYRAMTIAGEFFYFIEKKEDGTFLLIKYGIIDQEDSLKSSNKNAHLREKTKDWIIHESRCRHNL